MNGKFAKVRTMTLAVLFLCLLNSGVRAQDDSSSTINSIIQLPGDLSLEDHVYEDINLDGLKDLALSVSNRKKPYERSLRIYYQQDGDTGFKMEPDEIITLTTDVIAYAFADTDRNPGAEILLFTANACFGYRLQEESKGKIFKITDCEFLWQIQDPYKVFSWQKGVFDFNNDGRMDFVLPQSNGIKMFIQKEEGFVATPLLKMPSGISTNTSQIQVSRNRSNTRTGLSFDGAGDLFGAEKPEKPLVNVNHSINVPLFTDFDGDNLCDILQVSNFIYVWKQEKNEPYLQQNYIRLEIPKDISENAGDQYILDLNRDKRCDFILFARDRNTKKVFTQILIYINHKNPENEDILFDENGIPLQMIKIAGLPGKVQFEDINCDGYPDLSFITFNPDLLDQVKTLASKSIKLQFLAFINDNGKFSRNPDINEEINVLLDNKIRSEAEQGQFFIDYNKDGLLDILVRDTNNHIGLRLSGKTKNGINISNKNVWDMTIPEKSNIVYEQKDKDIKPVLLITGPAQIIHVRFK